MADADILKRLAEAEEKLQRRAPGCPSVELPLEKILTFNSGDEVKAVIPLRELRYLVDQLLRETQ